MGGQKLPFDGDRKGEPEVNSRLDETKNKVVIFVDELLSVHRSSIANE